MPSDRLRTLTRPKTLLLLGGAFGFVLLLACAFTRYRLVPDRLPRVPDTAVAAVVILDPESFSSMAPLLPPSMRYRVEEGQGVPAVFFAVPNDETGRLEWHDLDTLSSVRPGTDGFRLIRRADDFYGEVRTDRAGWSVPFHGDAGSSRLRLDFGRKALGWAPNPSSAYPEKRRITALPPGTDAYVYSFSSRMVANLLAGANDWFDLSETPSALFEVISGTFELAVSASGSLEAFRPFLAFSRLSAPVDRMKFTEAAKSVVAAVDPSSKEVTLEDGTISKEYRPSAESVVSESTELKSGEILRFLGPSGSALSAFFRDDSELWMTSGTTTVPIQQGILSSFGGAAGIDRSCQPHGLSPGFILSGTGLDGLISRLIQSIGLIPGYSSVSFVSKDYESGLFTVCGYF